MKKGLFVILVLVFVATTVFATDFVPAVMKLSAPSVVHYDFDGTELKIPVNITGTTGMVTLLVFTKDQGDKVNMVKNGFLGWHSVNKIDTCVYAGTSIPIDTGDNTLYWNGKDNDGKLVPAGEYSYYVWGYDAKTEKKLVTSSITAYNWSTNRIVAHDYQGNPLGRPYINGLDSYWAGNGDTQTQIGRTKWIIGSDPMDSTLAETTSYLAFQDNSKFTPSPYEADKFFILTTDNNLFGRMRKYKYVPNGESFLETSWGDQGEFVYSIMSSAWFIALQDMDYIGNDLLVATNGDEGGISTMSELVMVDAKDGSEAFRIDLSDWWVSLDSAEAGGQAAAGPNRLYYRNGLLYLGGNSSCLNEVIDPHADNKDEVSYMRWMNGNGDYTGDLNYEPDSEKPWVCNDYNVCPWKLGIDADNNGFAIFPCEFIGSLSFGLYAPDGTGLGYHTLNENFTAIFNHQGRGPLLFLSENTAYDGIYADNVSTHVDGGNGYDYFGYWYTASDSFKGIITNQVSVDDAGPAVFSVAQNSPNPFNPSTTISFTIPEAGSVSMDVFNVAGQKVATVANEFMNAGSHSVTWEADGLSAGVYFYTVKTDKYSKTMKMTLLK